MSTHATRHSPGPWLLGKPGGCVVSAQPLPGYKANGCRDHVDYYGGYLIAESIWRKEDVQLIIAAPDLIVAAQIVLADLNARISRASDAGQSVPVFMGIADLHAAIAKATGVQS